MREGERKATEAKEKVEVKKWMGGLEDGRGSREKWRGRILEEVKAHGLGGSGKQNMCV